MSFISVFDVLGPIMVGPSSSHTAGCAAIGYLASKMMNHKIQKVDFTLYGSFAKTYRGHGSDRALLGGILGFRTDDIRIRDSFLFAQKEGLEYTFFVNEEETDLHPNTVDISMTDIHGKTMFVRGESIGGGKIRIVKINGVKVDFSGEYSALIIIHQDRPGVVAYITDALSKRNINIAFMRLFREGKGEIAYTILESDEDIPDDISYILSSNSNIHDSILIQKEKS